jgi:hypothetical protein
MPTRSVYIAALPAGEQSHATRALDIEHSVDTDAVTEVATGTDSQGRPYRDVDFVVARTLRIRFFIDREGSTYDITG